MTCPDFFRPSVASELLPTKFRNLPFGESTILAIAARMQGFAEAQTLHSLRTKLRSANVEITQALAQCRI
jgi:hypothetical protein